MTTSPPYDRRLSLALDRAILALEASRPKARKPLRVIKAALESAVPAWKGGKQ